jgi:hypothetical protein
MISDRRNVANQIFIYDSLAAPRMAPLPRRPDCPACHVGPAPLRQDEGEPWEAMEQETITAMPVSPVITTQYDAEPTQPSAASRLAGKLFEKFGILLGSLAFAAAPFGIMAIVMPIENANSKDVHLFPGLLLGVLFITIGITCVVWLCAGVAAVWAALANFFSDWD